MFLLHVLTFLKVGNILCPFHTALVFESFSLFATCFNIFNIYNMFDIFFQQLAFRTKVKVQNSTPRPYEVGSPPKLNSGTPSRWCSCNESSISQRAIQHCQSRRRRETTHCWRRSVISHTNQLAAGGAATSPRRRRETSPGWWLYMISHSKRLATGGATTLPRRRRETGPGWWRFVILHAHRLATGGAATSPRRRRETGNG